MLWLEMVVSCGGWVLWFPVMVCCGGLQWWCGAVASWPLVVPVAIDLYTFLLVSLFAFWSLVVGMPLPILGVLVWCGGLLWWCGVVVWGGVVACCGGLLASCSFGCP